jgi:hypothetical protein
MLRMGQQLLVSRPNSSKRTHVLPGWKIEPADLLLSAGAVLPCTQYAMRRRNVGTR